jgi:hypothetical protein
MLHNHSNNAGSLQRFNLKWLLRGLGIKHAGVVVVVAVVDGGVADGGAGAIATISTSSFASSSLKTTSFNPVTFPSPSHSTTFTEQKSRNDSLTLAGAASGSGIGL